MELLIYTQRERSSVLKGSTLDLFSHFALFFSLSPFYRNLFSNKIENLIAGVFPLPSLEYLYVESYSSSTCSISFLELRSPFPAVGKRELWEHPFLACAIDTIDADCAMRSETGCA